MWTASENEIVKKMTQSFKGQLCGTSVIMNIHVLATHTHCILMLPQLISS